MSPADVGDHPAGAGLGGLPHETGRGTAAAPVPGPSRSYRWARGARCWSRSPRRSAAAPSVTARPAAPAASPRPPGRRGSGAPARASGAGTTAPVARAAHQGRDVGLADPAVEHPLGQFQHDAREPMPPGVADLPHLSRRTGPPRLPRPVLPRSGRLLRAAAIGRPSRAQQASRVPWVHTAQTGPGSCQSPGAARSAACDPTGRSRAGRAGRRRCPGSWSAAQPQPPVRASTTRRPGWTG